MRCAILFDLDETLSDRAASVRRMTDVFSEHFGARLTPIDHESLHAAILDADDRGYRKRVDMAAQLCSRLPWTQTPEPAEIVTLWRAWMGRLAEPMPGLHSTLEQLHDLGFAMGVVTNGPSTGQNEKIDTIGIRHLLSAVLTSEEAGWAKPDPRIFASALAALSAEASRSWFVGDNPVADISGANEAGMRAVWMDGHVAWPDDLPAPTYSIQRLEQLLDLVADHA